MITFSRLEKKGNLGNQLFQIASTIGIALKNNHDFIFPKWSYSKFFQNKLPQTEREDLCDFELVNEKSFNFYSYNLSNSNFDLNGWFQSERYFNVEKVKYYFQFDPTNRNSIKTRFKEQLSKHTIFVSIRRGDYVEHPDFYQLSINYYINALVRFFPEWQNYSVFVFSDDYQYVKFHFSGIPNIYFYNDLSAIDQLTLASLCDDFIISNSTFSWWCAWLGEKEHSKIICPPYFFTAQKRISDNDIDFFPERWFKYDVASDKLSLNNFYFDFSENKVDFINYYKHYFCCSNDESVNAIIKFEDVFVAPFLIYYLYSQNKSFVVNSSNNVYISKKELRVLKKQLDFGIFSLIFNNATTKNRRVADIKVDGMTEFCYFNQITVGLASEVRGNAYLTKVFQKKISHEVKLFLKRIFFRKKYYSKESVFKKN